MPQYDGNFSQLAFYADPKAKIVLQIIRMAQPRLEALTGRAFTSFHKAAEAGEVAAIARALYEEILLYKPEIEFDRNPQVNNGVQAFRTVQESATASRANCLEIALLFASCALEAQLDPVLLSINAGSVNHALVGLWLVKPGPMRNRVCDSDGKLSKGDIPDLLTGERHIDAREYRNNLTKMGLLVLDCSGATLGYPGKNGRHGLSFDEAVEHGWELLINKSMPIHDALDLRQALQKAPFPSIKCPTIVGREHDFKLVAKAAKSKNVVISGPFGMGKSVLALYYAHMHRHDYPAGVFLLNASDQERRLEQIADFARKYNIKPEWAKRSKDSPVDNVLASYWADEVTEQGHRFLLIVDDVADAEFVTAKIEGMFSLASLGCRLLMTTRDETMLIDDPDFENIVLGPLADNDAITLLLNELPPGPPPDHQEKNAARQICIQLKNLPLFIRIVGLRLANKESLSLQNYVSKSNESMLHADESTMPPDYGTSVPNVLDEAWNDLEERKAGPQDILRLLSVLPRNESIPFEILALMLDIGDDDRNDWSDIERVRNASEALSATGLAEQPEHNAVRVHPVVYEFAKNKTVEAPGFTARALQLAVDRLHHPDFYRRLDRLTLITFMEQSKLLREASRNYKKLAQLVNLFDLQIDYLRQGYDALPQLALQARLLGAEQLAETLELVRSEQKGEWLRVRWHGRHDHIQWPETGGHSDAVSAVAIWSESSREDALQRAVSGAENGELIQWSLNPLASMERLPNIGAPVSGLCINPEGTIVYASARDGSLRAVALIQRNENEVRVVGRHSYPANDCAIDPLSRFVVSVSDDGMARVYDLAEDKLLRTFEHQEQAPLLKCAVACRPETGSPVLITASCAGVVRVWNPLTGDELGGALDLRTGEEPPIISACDLSPDGQLAAIATRREVLLWQPGAETSMNLRRPERLVTDCAFSPDGCRLMLVGRTKITSIYNIEQQKMERYLEPYYHWLTACAFGSNGQLIYASDDGSVHTLTYAPDAKQLPEISFVRGRPNWISLFRAGKEHVLSVSTDKTIYKWNLESGAQVGPVMGQANWASASAVSPNGKYILSGTDSGEVDYWSFPEKDFSVSLNGFTQRTNTCAISPDGTVGLAGSDDRSLRTWWLTGERKFENLNHFTDQHGAAITACAISNDGEFVLSGGEDSLVVLWDLHEGNHRKVFRGHSARITAISFTPDKADIFVTSSWDHSVRGWSIESGTQIMQYDGHSDSVTSCGAAEGGVVCSVSLDQTLHRWKQEGDDPAVRIHLGHRLRGLVVDPSGDWVICSDMTGTVFRFDFMSGADGNCDRE